MKKTLIIVGAVIVIGIIISVVLFERSGTSSTGGNGGTTGTLPPVATGTSYSAPTGTALTIGTPEGSITMNNFYNNPAQVSVDHTSVLIVQTDVYNITYYAPDSSFNILITATPFNTVRMQAEAAFLQVLGISQADACKLNVKVGAPIAVDPNYAGQNLGLSFCSSGGAFQTK